jgi:A/G-specific adenine glycosylase
MWELPLLKEGQENADSVLLTVRHAITNTNYYVTVYGLALGEENRLAKAAGERAWVPVRKLQDRPLTGLTRKILKRLKVMPGYNGAGPSVVIEEPSPDEEASFESSAFRSGS